MKLRRLAALLMAVLLIVLAAGCGKKDDEDSSSEVPEVDDITAEYPVTVTGGTVRSRPGSVMSLSPSLTEKIYDLGLEERLVGVSDFCDYPMEVEALPNCGTAQLPDLSAIRRISPHLLLVPAQLPESDLISLQQMDVEVVVIPAATSIAEYKESYITLSKLLEGEYTGGEMGSQFASNLQARLDFLSSYLVPYAQENGMKPALYLRLMDFTVATGDTLEHELMEAIGLRNIAQDQRDWSFDEEEARGDGRGAFESLEVYFMDENFVTIRMLEQSDFYKGLQATLKDWYLYIDCTVFERQGLRMLDILEDMAAYAYPEAQPGISYAGGTEEEGEDDGADLNGEDEDEDADGE